MTIPSRRPRPPPAQEEQEEQDKKPPACPPAHAEQDKKDKQEEPPACPPVQDERQEKEKKPRACPPAQEEQEKKLPACHGACAQLRPSPPVAPTTDRAMRTAVIAVVTGRRKGWTCDRVYAFDKRSTDRGAPSEQ